MADIEPCGQYIPARVGPTNDTIDDRTARPITVRGLIVPAVFLLSIGVAAVSLALAFVTPLLIGPLQLL